MPADAAFRWLGHSTVLLPGPPSVVVDPWRWRLDEGLAELVLVTHGHVDHLCETDLVAAAAPHATVVGPAAEGDRLRALFGARATAVEPGEVLPLGDASVTALPAAGPVRDGVACGFHPRGQGLSYLVDIGPYRYLHLGDSCALEEHEGLAPDVAFIPAGGMTVMDPDEAADAAERIGARLSVPIHWGDLNGRHDVARRFIDLCEARGLRAALV